MKTTPQPIEFTPIKLDVNFEAYKKAVDNGEAKIKNFSEALEWCYNNYVDDKDLNVEAFNLDMMLAYKEAFLKKNSKLVRLDIGYEKLIDLLDVNLMAMWQKLKLILKITQRTQKANTKMICLKLQAI